MSSHSSSLSPPRRKPNALWWILAAFAMLAGLFIYQLFGPNPPIVISKQTTFVTEPLLPNGLPDYRLYVIDRMRAGVTPENNAAVLMWQAMGPGKGSFSVKPADWPLLVAELRISPAINPAKYATNMYGRENCAEILRWLEQNAPDWNVPVDDPRALTGTGTVRPTTDAHDVIDAAMNAPWRAEQLPPLAEWVAANQAPLDLLVEASRRDKFYSPTPELLQTATNSTGVWTGIEVSTRVRDIARMLALRAMLRIGEGQYELAWQDLLAIHRWARLVNQGPTIIDQLIAISVDGIACAGTNTLLGNEQIPPELARQIQKDLAALGPASRMADKFDSGERIFILSVIVDTSHTGAGTLIESLDWNVESARPLNLVSFDWNAPLVAANRFYDRLAAACRIPDQQARDKLLRSIEADIQTMDAEFHSPAAWATGAISPGRRSELLAAAVITLFSPALTACVSAEDRSRANTALVEIAAALGAYRAVNGRFPDSLDKLVPDLLPKRPVDIFNARPFVYQRDGNGYLLYSLGENGTDDGGSNEQMSVLDGRSTYNLPHDQQEAAAAKIPADADDISIRVPTPRFTLPAPPPTQL